MIPKEQLQAGTRKELRVVRKSYYLSGFVFFFFSFNIFIGV